MHKVNTTKIVELTWSSPKGKFVGAGKEISEELGRKPESTDLNERHPFDVEILRIPPGKAPYSYHSHSAQWEFYHVISGSGVVRHKDGTATIEAGDAFIFKPGEPHQITNDTTQDMILYVVSDSELEFTPERDGPNLVCKYSRDGNSLRVIATLLGSPQAIYFKIIPEGLQRADGTVLYDAAHFDAAAKVAAAVAAQRQRELDAALASLRTPTPSATAPTLSISSAK